MDPMLLWPNRGYIRGVLRVLCHIFFQLAYSHRLGIYHQNQFHECWHAQSVTLYCIWKEVFSLVRINISENLIEAWATKWQLQFRFTDGTGKVINLHYCNFIISSHVPVSENIKYLLLSFVSNWRMSPAAIWILNNLFRYCIKLGPATMLLAPCSTGLL